ncbi:SpoIID/LytB domain-containing protein [Carboxydothermus pertinax]|uniref:Stage II sporulation protein D n=1 Tax=Carboxydothermus pertinax TaxID=870242 RepID=A0A1L8CY19_9THEO|nr:SpoIID/LytB domain-containing protein [Carboxydothermus pertinax]GAV23759.1 stage II sporulation protein D [Carboxydothermus pertinax]
MLSPLPGNLSLAGEPIKVRVLLKDLPKTESQKVKLTGNYLLYDGNTLVNNVAALINQDPDQTILTIKLKTVDIPASLTEYWIELYKNNDPNPFFVTKNTVILQAYSDSTGNFNLTPERSYPQRLERYRGDLILIPKPTGIRLINRLSLEKYLYGVVPNEVSAYWPTEAIKAQILAARTYAYSHRNPNSEFDLYSDQRSQVYEGLSSEFTSVNALVDQTAGEIITYNGGAISALFHSSNGGYIESNATIYGTSEYPYLKAKKDIYDDEAADLLKARGSSSYNVIRWTKEYTALELQQQLEKNGYGVGAIKEVKVTKAAATGRAMEVTVIGEKGSKILKYDGTIRKALGLNSSRFTVKVSDKKDETKFIPLNSSEQATVYAITGDGEKREVDKQDLNVIGADGIAMENGGAGYTIVEEIPQKYTFIGQGWGHGLGMSQWGAWAMAQKTSKHDPFDYKDIIKYYYTGVEITKKY